MIILSKKTEQTKRVIKCFICGENHYASECLNNKGKQKAEGNNDKTTVNVSDDKHVQHYGNKRLYTIEVNECENYDERPYVNFKSNKYSGKSLVDTGASKSLISDKILENFAGDISYEERKFLAAKSEFSSIGTNEVDIINNYNKKGCRCLLYIVQDFEEEMLFGIDLIKKLEIDIDKIIRKTDVRNKNKQSLFKRNL